MAGLESDERVYRGMPLRSWRNEANYPHTYREREVIHPLDVPVSHSLAEDSPPPSKKDFTVKTYVFGGCGLATVIIDTLLAHPLIVLRRQCQVNPGLKKYHLIPMTLVPVVLRLHQTQGINTLWKGVGSTLLVNGILSAIENFISKMTPWPNVITGNSSLKQFGQHVLLKCVSVGLMTPFYSASLVETVQSEITSEPPGIFVFFRDGAIRLLEVSNKGRLIPIYSLVVPTVVYAVSKYLFTLAIRGIATCIIHIRQKRLEKGSKGACSRDLLSETVTEDIPLQSILISHFMAEALFYPWETVIHRLHLQGTRTIIDDLDTGRSVTPLLTGYSGARDCYSTIILTEGPLGLYKGFGALLLEYTVKFITMRFIKWILTE